MTNEGDNSKRVDDEIHDSKAFWLALRACWDLKFSDLSCDLYHFLPIINQQLTSIQHERRREEPTVTRNPLPNQRNPQTFNHCDPLALNHRNPYDSQTFNN